MDKRIKLMAAKDGLVITIKEDYLREVTAGRIKGLESKEFLKLLVEAGKRDFPERIFENLTIDLAVSAIQHNAAYCK